MRLTLWMVSRADRNLVFLRIPRLTNKWPRNFLRVANDWWWLLCWFKIAGVTWKTSSSFLSTLIGGELVKRYHLNGTTQVEKRTRDSVTGLKARKIGAKRKTRMAVFRIKISPKKVYQWEISPDSTTCIIRCQVNYSFGPGGISQRSLEETQSFSLRETRRIQSLVAFSDTGFQFPTEIMTSVSLIT